MSSATAQLRTSVPKPAGPVLPSCDYESAPKQHQSIPIPHTSNYVWLSYERLPERTRLRRLLPQVVHPFTKQSPPWKRWGSLSYTSKGQYCISTAFRLTELFPVSWWLRQKIVWIFSGLYPVSVSISCPASIRSIERHEAHSRKHTGYVTMSPLSVSLVTKLLMWFR